MVSTRFKKRLVVLMFLGIIVLVCFYKIQQKRSDYMTRALKQTKDLFRVRSIVAMRADNEDDADDPEEEVNYNETAGRVATEPPTKIHRGLDGNEEVEDTLGWLQEHGVKPPPDPSPEADNEAETEPISTATPSATFRTSSRSTRLHTRPLTSERVTKGDPMIKSTSSNLLEPYDTSSKAINEAETEPISQTISTAPPSTTPRTSSSSTRPRTWPLTSERVTNGNPMIKSTSSNLLKPYDTSSKADTEAETEAISQTRSTSPPSTTPRTPSRSTRPHTRRLTSERVTEGDPTIQSTSSNLSKPYDRSSKAHHDNSSLFTHASVSERIKSDGVGLKSTSSPIALSDLSSKAQGTHAGLSSDVFTETNNTFTSPRTPLTTTGTPTPTYTTSPNLNTCKLPKLDPWDPSIKHLLEDVGNDPGCRNGFQPPAFDVISNRLVFTGEVNVDEIDFKHVNVETIHRNDGDDGNVHFINQGNPFTDLSADEVKFSNLINGSDFFKLTYNMKTGKENTHYFARVVPQLGAIHESTRIREDMKRQGKAEALELNVVMLGFDSVSAASFRRKMPKSLDFLKTSLKTYFISGQTVIGDGTTPALTAMLTGLFETEPPEGRQGFDNSAPIDQWPWLMTLYKEHGYVTMMAEDDPLMGAFNLRLRGFEDPPANHYARPFWLTLEQNYERDEPGLCSRSTFMTNYTLDYVLSYFSAYPDNLKFAFAFMSYLSHAHPNHLSFADNDLLRLLRTFVKRNYHENTVIVIFGDHGSRNDDVRNTMQGKLEERLPWLSISVPEWIEDKYPDITSALKNNQHVISSPFDLHATLHHVLTYPKEPQGEKTQSLFTKLQHTRTCSEAGVGEHWCPCLEFTDVNTTSPHVIGGANMAVKYINDVILNRTELLRASCERIQLKKILKAETFKPNEKLQQFSSTNQDSDRAVNFGSPTSDSDHYRINFMTSPGNALFEATVAIREDKKVIVNPDISRTNIYGNQPRCILRKYPYARKFCYCKGTRI